MRDPSTFEVTVLLCALGCGVMAGFFFAFSVCVMKALGKLPPKEGMAAMQAINVVVINPVFLGVFLGTGAACVVMAIRSLMRWSDAGAGWSLAGSVLYLGGAVGVTMGFNVPRNNALAAHAPASAEGEKFWTSYLSSWTTGNHVRMVAALAAAALFTIALSV